MTVTEIGSEIDRTIAVQKQFYRFHRIHKQTGDTVMADYYLQQCGWLVASRDLLIEYRRQLLHQENPTARKISVY